MASQQYSLRWNNYVRHMTSAFESLRSDRDLIDVTLSCEGKKIPAHKMLLSACSSYFKDLFKENPCQHPVIIFRNVTFDDLMALVDFMYNGEVNVEQEQLASFLNTAELLQVQGLTNSKDQEKSKKTAKEDDRVPATSQFDEDGEERSSTPTKAGPPAAKKRKWQSPSRTESPATVSELPAAQGSADGDGDEDVQSIDQVPLKTETPDYDDDDDLQGSGAEDTPDEHEIVQKLQKSDQLVLTSSRNRTSNSEHSLYGNNSMDMDSGDMSSFVMAGPSNESMGQEGMQDDFGYCEFFIAEECEMQYQVPKSGQWVIDSSFSIPIVDFEREVFKIKRKYKRRKHFTQRRLSRVAKNLPATWRVGRLAQQNGEPIDTKIRFTRSSTETSIAKPAVDGLKLKIKKKRGRRPKTQPTVTPETCQMTESDVILETKDYVFETLSNVHKPEHTTEVTEKKKRGRPKSKVNGETPIIVVPSAVPDAEPAVEIKRKRGRPSKASLLLASPVVPVVCNGDLPAEPAPIPKKPGPKPKKESAVYQPNFLQRAVQRLRIIERDNMFQCNKCGRTFKQKQRCLLHQNTHRSWFKCLKCNKSYINKRYLVHHEMMAHHEKPFKKK